MIALENENLIPLAQLPASLPSARAGKQISPATLYRWMAKGLETIKIGGTRYTILKAVERFAIQDEAPRQPRNRITPPPRAPQARSRLRSMLPGIN